MTTRLMLDLETLGTSRIDSPVIAVGAVIFNETAILDSHGWPLARPWLGRIDSNTVSWWMEQSEAARQMVFKPDVAYSSARFWQEFTSVIQQWRPQTVWANDPDFDVVLLQNWLAREQEHQRDGGEYRVVPVGTWPFAYNQYRAYRTLREIAGKAGWTDEMNGAARGMYVAHNPVEDAAAQARAVIAMEQFLLNQHAARRAA